MNERPELRAAAIGIIAIREASLSGKVLLSNQGQALDGISALIEYGAVADTLIAALAEGKPQESAVFEAACAAEKLLLYYTQKKRLSPQAVRAPIPTFDQLADVHVTLKEAIMGHGKLYDTSPK